MQDIQANCEMIFREINSPDWYLLFFIVCLEHISKEIIKGLIRSDQYLLQLVRECNPGERHLTAGVSKKKKNPSQSR